MLMETDKQKLSTSEIVKFEKFEKFPKNVGYKRQNQMIIHNSKANWNFLPANVLIFSSFLSIFEHFWGKYFFKSPSLKIEYFIQFLDLCEWMNLGCTKWSCPQVLPKSLPARAWRARVFRFDRFLHIYPVFKPILV